MADLKGLDTLVNYYGHAAGATDFFTSQQWKREDGLLGAISKVVGFFSDHPDEASRAEYLFAAIEEKGYKIGTLTDLPFAPIIPEVLSVAELVKKYSYDDLKRLNDSFGNRYYNIYERFWNIWSDGTIYQDNFTGVWLKNIDKAIQYQRDYQAYFEAAWISYTHLQVGTNIPQAIAEKQAAMNAAMQAQMKAEIEVLEAHRAALEKLNRHADTWRPLNKNTVKMGYKGGGAEFNEYLKKISEADAKRRNLWQERDRLNDELVEALLSKERNGYQSH